MTGDISSPIAPPALPRGLAAARRFLAWVGRVELVLAIAALLVVVVLSCAQTFLRYSVGGSLWWAQEIAENMILVCYFSGVSYVFKTRQEIYIEFAASLAPIRGQVTLFVVEQVVTIAFSLALLWLVWLFSPTMFNMQSPVLKLPGWVTFAPLVFSSAMIAVTSAYYLAFGIWALSRGTGDNRIAEVEARGLILRPWLEQP